MVEDMRSMSLYGGNNSPLINEETVKQQNSLTQILLEDEEDRLSALPDPALLHILSFLDSTTDVSPPPPPSGHYHDLLTLIHHLMSPPLSFSPKDVASILSNSGHPLSAISLPPSAAPPPPSAAAAAHFSLSNPNLPNGNFHSNPNFLTPPLSAAPFYTPHAAAATPLHHPSAAALHQPTVAANPIFTQTAASFQPPAAPLSLPILPPPPAVCHLPATPLLPVHRRLPPAQQPSSLSTAETSDVAWYPDSGASAHMTPDDGIFSHLTPYTGTNKILVGNGSLLPIKHVGSTMLHTSTRPLTLSNVLHVPTLSHNLLAVRKLCQDNKCPIEFSSNGFCLKDKVTGRVLLESPSTSGLYSMPSEVLRNWSNTGSLLLVISAPYLQCSSITGHTIGETNGALHLVSISSLVKANLHFKCCYLSTNVMDFVFVGEPFKSLQHVEELELGNWFYEVVSEFETKGWQLPQYACKCLTLNAFRCGDRIPSILCMLESCPNLETLVINVSDPPPYKSLVARHPAASGDLNCDLLQLKTVKFAHFEGPYDADEPIMKLVDRLLLKRATILEKMVIDVNEFMGSLSTTCSSDCLKIAQMVLSYPRSSPKAVVQLCY
ncbi:hypothetical protein BUALT_Bualt12G0011900 [Buddleja alternifolia]|uniref:Retrovirus-related Pol polyprotein from transposon TNT 1-94-like beta-barrel domain-containing protein n=1 Tax=Buddleja alternifolia TaxID=168488 RepID=A0AAV6WMI2_9LAMI|nr:hypothetical protein BUALT_Bualt12G0011900 [Buddleja alternifolia]